MWMVRGGGGGHLAGLWFSAGGGGGTIKVRVLVFQERRREAPPIEVYRVGRWRTGEGLAVRRQWHHLSRE
jgi:hypothetical protein